MRLKGKTALITGASRNIGKQIAFTFAREGADLILNTRSSNKELNAVAAQCRKSGVQIHLVLGDVSDPEAVRRMVQEGSDALGKIDILANACLFLASDESSYITGDRLNVVGGRYIV